MLHGKGRVVIGFTPIESAVAACLLDGLKFREMAEAMGCSVTLAHRHYTRLMDRFRVVSRSRLVQELHEVLQRDQALGYEPLSSPQHPEAA